MAYSPVNITPQAAQVGFEFVNHGGVISSVTMSKPPTTRAIPFMNGWTNHGFLSPVTGQQCRNGWVHFPGIARINNPSSCGWSPATTCHQLSGDAHPMLLISGEHLDGWMIITSRDTRKVVQSQRVGRAPPASPPHQVVVPVRCLGNPMSSWRFLSDWKPKCRIVHDW